MRSIIASILTVLLVLSLGFAQETPETLLQQGITALKASDKDHSQLVEAARLLTLASQGFEAAGNENAATEANSILYWCKKKMTLDDANVFQKKDAKVAEKAEQILIRKVDLQESAVWLKKADEYAQVTADPLLKAIRYFEVAERFKGTPEGMTALDQSLKLMKELANTGNTGNDATKVVGAAVKGDGKVYVQSNPVGASILVEAEDGLRDTGVKTPFLVQLPKGNAVLVLRKEKYEDQKVSIQIGDAIVKTDVTVLEKPKFDVDIIAEGLAGFFVYVDGKPVMDKTGKQAIAPCTIRLPSGNSMLGLAKEGFQDVVQRVMVKEVGMEPVLVRGKATAGKTVLGNPWNGVKYRVYDVSVSSNGWKGVDWFLPNGKFIDQRGVEGTWTLKANELYLSWPDGGKSVYSVDSTWTILEGIKGNNSIAKFRGTNLTNADPPPINKPNQ